MRRILVIDDEPLISMLVEDWLTELGCEVVGPARTVQDGLDLIEKSALDGAILDVNLGSNKSFLVAEALRDRGVPFAFATGDGDIGQASGFPDPLVLQKPFDFEAVKSMIEALLDENRKVNRQ